MLKIGPTLNMERFRRMQRIESLIDRLSDRGTELMGRAIATGGVGLEYQKCVMGIMVASNRCLRLAAYVNELARPTNRRTA